MSAGFITPANLFKVASVINALSVPGHTKYGYDYVYSALNVIPAKGEYSLGRFSAQYAWNAINAFLALCALLYWQWSISLGPQTVCEKIMFWTIFAIDISGGWRYYKIGAYQPLGCCWMAPVCSVLALAMLR